MIFEAHIYNCVKQYSIYLEQGVYIEMGLETVN